MSKDISFHGPELIAAIVFVFGVIGTILAKYKGLITFGKPIERRACPSEVMKVCGEHNGLVLNMANISTDVSELKQGQTDAYKLLRELNGKVERLIGYQAGFMGADIGKNLQSRD
jgi:hypothetical protein